MARARSTVSMALTTPAQKPRGEQSTILRVGLAFMRAIRTESPHTGRAGTANMHKDLGRLSGAVKADRAQMGPRTSKPLRIRPPTAYIGPIPVIADDQRLCP